MAFLWWKQSATYRSTNNEVYSACTIIILSLSSLISFGPRSSIVSLEAGHKRGKKKSCQQVPRIASFDPFLHPQFVPQVCGATCIERWNHDCHSTGHVVFAQSGHILPKLVTGAHPTHHAHVEVVKTTPQTVLPPVGHLVQPKTKTDLLALISFSVVFPDQIR